MTRSPNDIPKQPKFYGAIVIYRDGFPPSVMMPIYSSIIDPFQIKICMEDDIPEASTSEVGRLIMTSIAEGAGKLIKEIKEAKV